MVSLSEMITVLLLGVQTGNAFYTDFLGNKNGNSIWWKNDNKNVGSTIESVNPNDVGGQNWIGTNNYFLWACEQSVQEQTLENLMAKGIKVVRIFFVGTDEQEIVPNCGGKLYGAPEYEPDTIGVYNGKIIERVLKLMNLIYTKYPKLKLTLSLHDRYSLGCIRSDAYQKYYNFPKTPPGQQCSKSKSNVQEFYNNSTAIGFFKKRLDAILTNMTKNVIVYGNTSNRKLFQATVFSVEAENEPMFMDQSETDITNKPIMKNWACTVSSKIRQKLNDNNLPNILITNGGGSGGYNTIDALCPDIDVLALHIYNIWDSQYDYYRCRMILLQLAATKYGKKYIIQEFGFELSKEAPQPPYKTKIDYYNDWTHVLTKSWGNVPNPLPPHASPLSLDNQQKFQNCTSKINNAKNDFSWDYSTVKYNPSVPVMFYQAVVPHPNQICETPPGFCDEQQTQTNWYIWINSQSWTAIQKAIHIASQTVDGQGWKKYINF